MTPSSPAWETLIVGVGMPEFIKLCQFGEEVWDFFGEMPYLVGSAAAGKTWRDVDVRLVLSDEAFERWFGAGPRGTLNARWNAACLAFSARGREMTGLPIDFQVQQQSDADRKYGDRVGYALHDTNIARNEAVAAAEEAPR